MEKLVRTIIAKYNAYVSEAKLYEKWLSQVDDNDAKASLTLLQLRIAAIDAWLNLLTADERFVIQKHLIDALDWPRVAFAYTERWNHEFVRGERSLQNYQTSALSKIVDFAERHKEILTQLFSDILSNDENLQAQ